MKPLCPECGDRHEKHQAHVWKSVSSAVSIAESVSSSVSSVPNTSMDYLRVKEWRKANRRRYLDLQKVASKKYREKKKAERIRDAGKLGGGTEG